MSKLVLGTAQFGVDYGINNKRGKIPQSEVWEILESALKSGIDTIDTASSYGESEKVIGEFIKSNNNALKVISKLPECGYLEVKEMFEGSLKKLGVSVIYGYLIHNFISYKNDEKIWDELENLRYLNRVKKIGFSLYYPEELQFLIDRGLKVDIIQLPFSVFDQRFEQYLPVLKKMSVEIHARSIFLQGLVFKRPKDLNGHFKKIKGSLEKLNHLADELGVSMVSLCTNFVMANKYIDKVVVGVDSLGDFIEIAGRETKRLISAKNVRAISDLRIKDDDIILPFNWRQAKVKN